MKKLLVKLTVCIICLLFISCDVSQNSRNGLQTISNDQTVLQPNNNTTNQQSVNSRSNQQLGRTH